MATISELAQMSSNVYDGTSSPTQNSSALLKGGLTNWVVFANTNTQNPLFWGHGYFGVAYRNTVTGEVVIANRGTDWGHGANTIFKNLASDMALARNKVTQVQLDAVAFAQQVALSLQGTSFTSLIETGHSLGGNEAQAAVAYLVDRGLVPRGIQRLSIRRTPFRSGWLSQNDDALWE